MHAAGTCMATEEEVDIHATYRPISMTSRAPSDRSQSCFMYHVDAMPPAWSRMVRGASVPVEPLADPGWIVPTAWHIVHVISAMVGWTQVDRSTHLWPYHAIMNIVCWRSWKVLHGHQWERHIGPLLLTAYLCMELLIPVIFSLVFLSIQFLSNRPRKQISSWPGFGSTPMELPSNQPWKLKFAIATLEPGQYMVIGVIVQWLLLLLLLLKRNSWNRSQH